jgi:cell wall-associated NlpC family hydrolase
MASVREKCERVIEVALSLQGSHYLWGAAGATPGGSEGINRRPGSVTLAPPRLRADNPAVFAAQCSVDGLHVCGGRWDAGHGGIEGGRSANPADQDLVAYLASLEGTAPEDWQPYYEYFSPRVQEGKTVPRQLVWGEDCRGKQHFDCVGFVNYCVELALDRSRDVQYSIEQWAGGVSGTTAVPLTDPPYPADILITNGFKHIGFLVGDGEVGDGARVVQAEQTSTGVLTRDYAPNGWAYRRRLTAAILGA